MSLSIGIIYSGSGSKLLCCTKEGVFKEDSLFSLTEKYGDSVVWFTNMNKDLLINEDQRIFKDKNFFGESISDIMSFYGFKMTKTNVIFVVKKYYDFASLLINNILEQHYKGDIENKNKSIKSKRENDRVKLIKRSNNYANLIALASYSMPKHIKVGEIEYIDDYDVTKKIDFYPNKYYKIPTTASNREVETWLKIHGMKRKEIQSSKQFDAVLKTLNVKLFKDMPVFEFFNIDYYEVVNLEGRTRTPDDYNRIIKQGFSLFRIQITSLNKAVKDSAIAMMMKNDFIVTKEMLFSLMELKAFKFKIIDGLLLNENLQIGLNKKSAIEKEIKKAHEEVDRRNVVNLFDKLNKIKAKLPESIVFSSGILSTMISDELLQNRMMTAVYLENYLQTILLNDNFLLNELIKSSLYLETIKRVAILISKGIEVVGFSEKEIKISIGHDQKEEVRKLLEKLEIVYSSDLF